jgi:hypothetical protein
MIMIRFVQTRLDGFVLVLAHWNNSLWKDMSLHSHILSNTEQIFALSP